MAFKMKGSAFKLNKVATKSTMKMAKKAKERRSAMDMKKKSPYLAAKPDYPDIDGDGNTTESMKQAAADKKSPIEQKTKFTDKLKAFGTAMTSEDGLMTSGLGAVYQAKDRYDREKKKYRQADRKSKMNKK